MTTSIAGPATTTDVHEAECLPSTNGRPTSALEVSVVIPTKDEARNIAWVLAKLPPIVDEVILVDSSSDNTVAVARAVRPDIVVVHEPRPGKGAALRTGFAAATRDIVVMIDADGSMDPAEIERYAAAVTSGQDMVKGSRFLPGAGTTDMEALRRYGNATLRSLVNALYRAHFSDLCYGFMAFRRDRIALLGLKADGFEIETEIVVRALKAGLSIGEVPSFEAPRRNGNSHLNTWRDGSRVLRTLLRERIVRDPAAGRGGLGKSTAREAGQLLAGPPRADRDVSVVICSFSEDRWDELSAAVRSVARQANPPLETIVVIDHNEGLMARACQQLNDVTVVANDGPAGLSAARNTGVAAARGSIIAFLDDDAVAEPQWIERLLAGYDDPNVAGVGGAVEPVWPAGRPRAFPPEFDWVVGCTYRGLTGKKRPVRNMLGANMSFRREVFDAVGGFHEGVGRVSGRPLGCEETELCIRARRRDPDAVFLFEPEARVHHTISAERTAWSYFRSRCYAEGISKARVSRLAGRADALSTERRYVSTALARGVLMGLADAVLARDAAGATRAAAIVAGLLVTTTGYAAGSITDRQAVRG